MALHREGRFSASQFERILDVIGRYGDRALKFIWEHKGALVVTGVLAKFLHEPELFINGAKDITAVFAAEVGRTAATTASNVVADVAGHINWNLWVGIILGVIGLKWGVLTWWKSRRQRKAVEA